VIANYPQNCEGVLEMGEIPSGNWRAYPGHPKQKKIITGDGVSIYSNRPLSCAYADITIVVVGRGTQFELSYLFLSE
jgi:hypothetical protein